MNRQVVSAMRKVLYPEVDDIPGFESVNGGSMIRLITQITYSASLNARYKKNRCKSV